LTNASSDPHGKNYSLFLCPFVFRKQRFHADRTDHKDRSSSARFVPELSATIKNYRAVPIEERLEF
jgi:hypothetical protein